MQEQKKYQIEKVENRNMIECDKFLMVSYYPSEDKISHTAFIYPESVENAKSLFSVGQWKLKTIN